VNNLLLALAGAIAGLLYLAHEHSRVAGARRGLREQLQHQMALLKRRAAVVTEYVEWAQRSGSTPATDLERLGDHQTHAEHSCNNLGRHPGDCQALEAFKASGIQLLGSREALGVPTRVRGAAAEGEQGTLLLLELERLDQLLAKQTLTTCNLAELLEQTRKRPVARLSSLVAHFGILPGASWGFRS
jgi:hypothetical protein